MRVAPLAGLALGLATTLFCAPLPAEIFRVATFNLENYLDHPTEARPQAKSPEARIKVCESIRALKPDVIALQEIGGVSALLELRAALQAGGLEFPYWEHVAGFDTNTHVAVLSRLPIVGRRPHTNDNFVLDGRRFRVSRGFAEVDIRVNPDFRFTLIAAHLKSRREIPEADQAELRLEEARQLREKVDAVLAARPDANLVVLGDFNDSPNSPSTRAVIGRGRFKLVDTRPAERNGDSGLAARRGWEPRTVTWTHYYGVDDTYSRIDYLLLSPNLARCWRKAETYVLALPNWGLASDHRPLVAAFETETP